MPSTVHRLTDHRYQQVDSRYRQAIVEIQAIRQGREDDRLAAEARLLELDRLTESLSEAILEGVDQYGMVEPGCPTEIVRRWLEENWPTAR
jgi:hypothetical protein